MPLEREFLRALFGSMRLSALLFLGTLWWAEAENGPATSSSSVQASGVNATVDAGGFPLVERPAVAMLFQIRRQLSTNTIWERWYRDAFDWIYAQGLEDPKVTPMENSTILRSYINYSPAFSPEAVVEFLPPALKHALIPGSAECVWANLNPCNYRLFLEAYTEFPEAKFFIFNSHNTMPLKPFSHIYEALKKDRRVRTTLVSYDFAGGLPKTTTWRGEPRELVELRVWDPDWLSGTWLRIEKRLCGPDECHIWKPLVRQYANNFTKMFALSDCQDHMACFMFDCWGDMKECVDSGESPSRIPYDYDVLYRPWFDKLLQNPDRWFLRKVRDNTIVRTAAKVTSGQATPQVEETGTPLMDYVADFFKSKHKDIYIPEHPHANETVPKLKLVSIYELHEAYKNASLYGLRAGL